MCVCVFLIGFWGRGQMRRRAYSPGVENSPLSHATPQHTQQSQQLSAGELSVVLNSASSFTLSLFFSPNTEQIDDSLNMGILCWIFRYVFGFGIFEERNIFASGFGEIQKLFHIHLNSLS